jgi:molecular chaperone GrpE (heat shock protein)
MRGNKLSINDLYIKFNIFSSHSLIFQQATIITIITIMDVVDVDAMDESSSATTTAAAEKAEEQRHENEISKLESEIAEAEGGSGGNTSGIVKSYRCVTTGKLFRSTRDMELYAERTGHTDFEETDMYVCSL